MLSTTEYDALQDQIRTLSGTVAELLQRVGHLTAASLKHDQQINELDHGLEQFECEYVLDHGVVTDQIQHLQGVVKELDDEAMVLANCLPGGEE